MLSVSARRLEQLNNKQNADTYEAVKWLEEGGQNRFASEVFLPPYLSLGVKDKSLAATAESCFHPGDLLVFLLFCCSDIGIYMFFPGRL